MLQLYDLIKNKTAGLINYKELKVERTLDGEEVLFFLYPQADKEYKNIKEECYIRTKKNEYVIKELNIQDDWTEFVAKVNVEDIKGNPVNNFEAIEQICSNAVNLALVGTDWTIGGCDVTKKRTVRKANCSSYDVLKEIRDVYMCNYRFDAINKKIYIYQSMGEDRGVYFAEELNLKKLQVQSNSYDYCTRIIPIGKDKLSIKDINGGKEYVENYQYSNKVITVIWEDNRYTVKESLLEDARLKLNELSKPIRSYSVEVFDLANLNNKYKDILDYDLGDTITLLSKEKKIKEKQRIIKLIEYPDEPEKNKCEIANRTLRFEDIQADTFEAVETINSVTTSDGLLDGSKIDSIDGSIIKNLKIMTADIQDLNVVTARIGDLEATRATITQLNAIEANVDTLDASKANITDLNVTNAKINTLEAQTATINTIFSDVIQAGQIVAGSSVIAEGAIGDAQISDLNAAKIDSGTLNTSLVDIASADGRMLIKNNSILTYDYINNNLSQPYLRTQIGRIWDVQNGTLTPRKDSNGNYVYGFEVRDKDGQTVMIDGQGVHNAGITNGAVDNSKIAPNANIDGAKINIESVVNEINNGSTHISGSKILVNDKMLEVEISDIKTNVNYKVDIISTNGGVFKNGQISTTLIARVYHGSEDITDSIDANRFRWTRVSNDTAGDIAWNTAHFGGTKQITITNADVYVRATFNCEILEY